MAEIASLLLYNGRIFRSLKTGFAQAITLRGNKITGVGAVSDLDSLIGSSTRKINLAGRTVVAGFNDSHQHPVWCGLDDLQVDLSGATSVSEIVESLAAAARSTPSERWIVGVGYDQAKLRERRHPTAIELQQAAPGRPVVAYRTCRHTAVASTVALALCETHSATRFRTSDNRLEEATPEAGLLREAELESLASVMPPLRLSQIVDAIDLATQKCLRYGITSLTDAAVGMRAGVLELDAYRIARQENRLNVRTELAFLGGPSGLQAELLLGSTLESDEWLRAGPIKLFMDGAAGGGTARMTEPYVRGGVGADRSGLICLDEGYLQEIVPCFIHAGKTIMTHAIGDAAIDRTLDLLAATPHSDFRGRRHRIEHATFARADQIIRMAELGVSVSLQPLVIHQSGDLYCDMLGMERARRAIPIRAFIDAGLRPASSSDAPISSVDPLVNIRSMVMRTTAAGRVLGVDQKLSVAEAVQCLNENAAYIGNREDQIGTLEEGQLADLAVISDDIFDINLESRPLVDLTICDGAVVYDRKGEFLS